METLISSSIVVQDNNNSSNSNSNSVTSTPSSSPLITKSAGAAGGGGSVGGGNRSEAEASSDDVDILFSPSSPGYLKSEEYRLLFRLPSDEVLVQDFNCAFQENILLQGHMYLFVRHICFYSNIFGYETKKAIPFNEVTCIRKAKTAGIFPNAIDIIAGGKRYFFASFLSRDEAYRAIVDGWAQHCDGIEDRIDRQDSKCEIKLLLDSFPATPDRTPDNGLSTPDRNTDALLQGHELSFGGSNGIVEVNIPAERPSEVEEIVEHTEPVVAADPSSSSQSLRWTPEDADAPQVPEFFTKVAESKFEIQVEEFFNHFFSDAAVDFVESFHKKCGDKDFRCSSWYEHEKQLGMHVMCAKFGQCQEVQKFRVYRNSHLVIETSQEVGGRSYMRLFPCSGIILSISDYYKGVFGLWDVKKVGNETNLCLVRVYVNVAFSKKTMWKGKIESNTIDECRDAYAIWMENALELVKQKALSKLESGVSSASVNPSLGAIPNDEVQLETVGPSELNDNSVEITTHAATNTRHSRNRSRRLRESYTDEILCVYENQNRLPLILVIASISILILMQHNRPLARPPQVHVISQVDYMNSFGNNGGDKAEAVAWLEKRIHHLKDEMLMTSLEKMRHLTFTLENLSNRALNSLKSRKQNSCRLPFFFFTCDLELKCPFPV
ncbi:hypothetical protein MKW92_033588 [Papaver armeniacum]|nr:hypothetical protein MKW92_033588 [Papaver armeniacum]